MFIIQYIEYMKRFNSIIALAFLTGITSLFLGCCTEERQGAETMVPLRLSVLQPSILSDSLSTRASVEHPFKIALSTKKGEYANMAKEYNAVTEGGNTNTSFAPVTPGDEVMISRLATTTPLTLYGTLNLGSRYGSFPLFYSGNVALTEGVTNSPLPAKTGNTLIFVNTTTIGYKYEIQITGLHSPELKDGAYTWDTTGEIPVLKAGSDYPEKFESTENVTSMEELGGFSNSVDFRASVAPATLAKGVQIMTLTEYQVGGYTPLATYTVYTPSAMTFEANKCYFITVNVDRKQAVMTGIQITPMTEIPIEIRDLPGIYDLQDLKDFRDAWNANKEAGISSGKYDKWMNKTTNTVTLHADIDLDNEEWTPIGTNETTPFTTITFDGNGHTISNLKETNKNIGFGGFFGYVKGTTVKGLTVKNAMLTATTVSGVIAGRLESGTISNCHVTGTSTISNAQLVSGIAGYMGSSTIEGCSVSKLTITETSGSYGSGIAMDGSGNGTIIACSVSDCSIESSSASCGISYGRGNTNFTACIVYNTRLNISNATTYDPTPIGYMGEETACYYANVTDTSTGAVITSEQGYLPTVNDLKSSATDQQLNNALKAKDPSFPFHFENGEIKEGAPT